MRVLLTRPRPDADRLAPRIRAMGHVPVIAPVIEIVPIPSAMPEARVDALVVTSRHAVAALMEADRAGWRGLPVFAVGEGSARAARDQGWKDVRMAAGDGQALGDLVRLTLPRPARLLYLAGHVHRPQLPERLRRDGYDLTVVETYDAVPLPWGPTIRDDLRHDPPGAVLHFSRRSAELALEATRDPQDTQWFAAASHVCLSDDVAAPLVGGGVFHVVTAAEPRTDSLLEALAAAF